MLTACSHRRKERPYVPFQERLREVQFDWNQDGKLDRAVLMSGTADFLEFAVWLSAVGGEKKVVANTSFVSARSMPGARLEISPSGVITIIDDHSGVGAAEAIYEWTVAFTDRSFVLAGYEYEFYDQLSEHKRGHCALNLLDGSGRVNGTNVSFAPIVKDINMITVDFQPRLCKFKFNDL